MVSYCQKLGFCFFIGFSVALIIGKGPDFEAMAEFAASPFDHYFSILNKIIVLPAFSLGVPEKFNWCVYIFFPFFFASFKQQSLMIFLLGVAYCTIALTGNYRIALSALLLSFFAKRSLLSTASSFLVHNSAVPMNLAVLFFPTRTALLLAGSFLVSLSFFLFLDEILLFAAINPSLITHIDKGADLDTGVFSQIGAALYFVLFFLHRKDSKIFFVSAMIALIGAITGSALFTRLLMFGKIHYMSRTWAQPSSNKIFFEAIIKLIMILLILRNPYYWEF